MKKILLLHLIYTIFSFAIYAETPEELLLQIKTEHSKNKKIKLIEHYVNHCETLTPDESIQSLEELLVIVPESSFTDQCFLIKRQIAFHYDRKGEFDKALNLLHKLVNETQTTESLRKYRHYVFTDIGMIHYYNKKYEKSLEYFKSALEEKQKFGSSIEIASALHNIGTSYSRTTEYDSAHYYLNSALEFFIELNDSGKIAQTYNNLGTLFHRQIHDVQKAENYFLKALEIHTNLNETYQMGAIYGNLGVVAFEQQKVDESLIYLKKALHISETHKIPALKILSLSNIYQIYDEIQQYDSAFYYQSQFYDLQDSLNLHEQTKKIEELEAIYQNEKAQQEIEIGQLRIRGLYNWIIVAVLLIVILVIIAFYFKQKKKVNEDLERYKARFYANIAHEFRTPVSLIQAPLEELLEKSDDSETKQKLNLALKNTDQILKLFNQLLDVSKLENNKISVVNAFGDLISFSENIITRFRPLAAEKNITIYHTANRDTLISEFDPDKLEKAFSNLLSNAIKFSPNDSTVTILSDHIEQNGNLIFQIKVIDQGMGIDKNDIDKLFNRFYRGENAQHNFEGTGLGLSLAKELTELMGGKLELSSTSNAGSTFIIEIPVKQYVHETIFSDQGMLPYADEPLEVLIVEDNDELRGYLVNNLISKGIKCYEALNGKIGFELAQLHVPDIIISDVMMPVCDGITFSKNIKDSPVTEHIPIILLSAKSAVESRLEGLESGAISYMTKPFHTKELMVYIENFLLLRKSLKDHYEQSVTTIPTVLPNKKIVSHENHFIQDIINLITIHLDDEEFSIEQLSRELALSRTQVHRKVNALTGLSASVLIRNIRLEKSLELLKDPRMNISEVSYMVGFSSPSYFSKCFMDYFGVSPRSIREK